jgi:hypothetical protein
MSQLTADAGQRVSGERLGVEVAVDLRGHHCERGQVGADHAADHANSGIRGYLPRTMRLICLTLMWME